MAIKLRRVTPFLAAAAAAAIATDAALQPERRVFVTRASTPDRQGRMTATQFGPKEMEDVSWTRRSRFPAGALP